VYESLIWLTMTTPRHSNNRRRESSDEAVTFADIPVSQVPFLAGAKELGAAYFSDSERFPQGAISPTIR
jgi:hypothetical protein